MGGRKLCNHERCIQVGQQTIKVRAIIPSVVYWTQTMTMHQAKSRRDGPTLPRYAMSGFHIRMDVFLYVSVP